MTANKVPGVRAAACYSVEVARNSREHNGANVLTLGSKTINSAQMRDIVHAWLATEMTEERHRKRVAKIEAIERQYLHYNLAVTLNERRLFSGLSQYSLS